MLRLIFATVTLVLVTAAPSAYTRLRSPSRLFAEPSAPVAACRSTDPSCKVTWPRQPPPDPAVISIALQHPAIRQIVGSRQVGTDYWVNYSPLLNGSHGANGGTVDLVFLHPISFAGQLPSAADPCTGKFGNRERVAANDPCLTKPLIPGAKSVNFTSADGIRLLRIQVHLGGQGVVNVNAVDLTDQTAASEIEALSAQSPAPP